MAIPTKREILTFSPMNLGEKEDLPSYQRDAFDSIKTGLNSGLMLAITGLRQVGKTTLTKQLCHKDAFYFSFDEKKYANPESLKEVIQVFLQEQNKPRIILDEISRVEDWSGIIKKYHDQKKAQFILTGSSSLKIKKGIESLAGRMLEYYLPPLQFNEYLKLQGKKAHTIKLEEVFSAKHRNSLESEAFLWQGSFPEAVSMDQALAKKYIQSSTVEKIIFEDIPDIFQIQHSSKLYDLMKLCANQSSKLFTETSFAESLQMSRHLVSDYLQYLQQSYLNDIIYLRGSSQNKLKKLKKVMVRTASIYNAVADTPDIGQAAETAVYDKLAQGNNIRFYRDPQKREVDFISDYPVEVKYRNTITNSDTRNMVYYLKKYKQKKGIIVTKNMFDEKTIDGKTIQLIPLDVFLLTKLNTKAQKRGK